MILQRLALRAALACALLGLPARAPAAEWVSWYGSESGRVTASGARFAPDGLTCAHRSWPFGTRVQVADPATGRTIICTVNDRGPAAWTGRGLDLARGAAARLGMIPRGVIRAQLTIVR